MEINLNQNDRFRVKTNRLDNCGENFIDINGLQWEAGIAVDMYPSFHYIEMRKKERGIRLFLFKNKGAKKDFDLGWWDDAEVIFALNEINK